MRIRISLILTHEFFGRRRPGSTIATTRSPARRGRAGGVRRHRPAGARWTRGTGPPTAPRVNRRSDTIGRASHGKTRWQGGPRAPRSRGYRL